MSSRRRSGARATAQQRIQKAKRQKQMLMGGVGLIIAAMIAFGIYSYLQNQNLPGEKFDDLGNVHLSAEPTDYIWNSSPPTSGPHAPNIAAWGVKTEPVANWQQIHNLEDGGVIVHYNCPDGCPEIVEQLNDIMRDIDRSFEQMILQPYPDMEHTIALTAWTRMLTMDEVNEDEIRDFINEYRGDDHHVTGQG